VDLNPKRLFKRRTDEQRALDTDSPLVQAWLASWATATSSGASVTSDSAVAAVAVLACLQVRAETFSSLPGGVFTKDGEYRRPATDHPVMRLLFDRPNDVMTSGEMWRWKSIRQDTHGNAYIRIVWKNGWPVALWPLTGDNPKVISNGSNIAYRYEGDKFTPKDDYPSTDILHFKGPMLLNPYEAKSLVTLTAENIGLALDTEKFFARFLGNGNHFPLYLQTEQSLDPKDIQALREQMANSSGVLTAGETRVFDRGLKVMGNSMSLKEADLSGHQRWVLEQVCRTWRVPLPLVQDWTHGTYTNNEQGGLWFVQHTIAPMCIDSERVCKKLFLSGESSTYVKFNIDGLLRGDFATRMAGYTSACGGPFMTREQVRALEDWDPLPGLEKPLVPLNMGLINEAGGIEPTQPDPGAPSMTPPTPRSLDPLLDDARSRIAARHAQDVERGRDISATREFAQRVIGPLVDAEIINDPDGFIEEALR